MIISHKYKFIFVKTYKTAGTSLEVALSDVCDDGDIFTQIFPPVSSHKPRNCEGFYNHISAKEIRAAVSSDIWSNYYKFCVERNPWDKVLSFYWMEKARYSGKLTLDDFLLRENIGVNWNLYSDDNLGEPIVDKILRYESLEHQLASLFKTLDVPWVGINVRAKSEYRLDRRSYRDILIDHQVELIKKRFWKEIAFHGYLF
jgi:hypothetical protein